MKTPEIQEAIKILENINSEKPALVVMPPDFPNFLQGNRGGLVNLAIASLRAAEGEKQTFKNNPWLVVQDYDFDLAGIELDEDAHIYLPPVLTKRQTFRKNFWGAVVGLLVVASIAVGFVTIIYWLIHVFFK